MDVIKHCHNWPKTFKLKEVQEFQTVFQDVGAVREGLQWPSKRNSVCKDIEIINTFNLKIVPCTIIPYIKERSEMSLSLPVYLRITVILKASITGNGALPRVKFDTLIISATLNISWKYTFSVKTYCESNLSSEKNVRGFSSLHEFLCHKRRS